jgi:LacI family gluconate utilization system Gnt-I transcriptional repressor
MTRYDNGINMTASHMTKTAKSRASGRATLADVAARAGVATMTASRAISHPDQVSEALRARVQQAVAELNYVPNQAARALATAESNVIVVLVPASRTHSKPTATRS